MANFIVWSVFFGYILAAMLYLAATHTEDDDKQQH